MKRKRGSRTRRFILYVLIIICVAVVYSALFSHNKVEDDKYYQIVDMIYKGEILEFTLDVNNGNIKYVIRETGEKRSAIIPNPKMFHEDISDFIIQHNLTADEANIIKQDYVSGFQISNILSMLPTVVIIILGIVAIKRLSNYMSPSKEKGFTIMGGRNQLNNKAGDNKITFEDVAGCDEEKAELVEVVDFLKNPGKYSSVGARIPHGILLVGPPGTGKTLLAKSVAGEAGVPFYSISGSDFVEMFAGVGAKRVRELFESAKVNAPSIIFIDEIDAVGRKRSGDASSGADSEREQTLNQLLVELDGFNNSSGVIVLAATNRPDILDSALLRPGRFDRQVLVSYPDIKGREAILKVHSKGKKIASDVDFKLIAGQTHGFTGADIANLLNEAALKAVKEKRKSIIYSDIRESMVKVIVGIEKKTRTIAEKEKMLTSYHEAGHAIVSYFLSDGEDVVSEISIISRGSAAGYTLYNKVENFDKVHITEKELKNNICALLGGRAAEDIYTGGNVSAGAANDISRATKIAREMVVSYGMNAKLGIVNYSGKFEENNGKYDEKSKNAYSDATAALIDEEVRNLIFVQYEKAKEILKSKRKNLDIISTELFNIEKMSGDRFMQLM